MEEKFAVHSTSSESETILFNASALLIIGVLCGPSAIQNIFWAVELQSGNGALAATVLGGLSLMVGIFCTVRAAIMFEKSG